MPSLIGRLLPGASASIVLAAAARRTEALSNSGALAATGVGTVIYTAGGIPWSSLLLLFFTTSSLLSRLPSRSNTTGRQVEKPGPRDGWQVAANGGIPSFVAILSLLRRSPFWSVPMAGALSCAMADTWATEVGSRFGGVPRLITTGARVPRGTSGAVTVAGTAAAFAGSTLLGSTAALATSTGKHRTAVAAAGFLGSIVDSLLGATVQEQLWCPTCDELTEQHFHRTCGTTTSHHSGIRGLNNDAVNALACAASACICSAMARVSRQANGGC